MPPTSYGDYRLPRGRHQLSPGEVAENRRWRLIGAASEVVAERRLRGLTARLISRRAAVSNYTFYEHFSDVDDILTVGFGIVAKLLIEVVGSACAEHEAGVGGRQAALAAALAFGAREPGLAALLRTEIAVALPEVAAERESLFGRLGALVTHGRGSGEAEALQCHRHTVGAALALGLETLEARPATAPDAAEELAHFFLV